MPEQINERLIEREMKESYLDYAMSVIIDRALPNAKDGLKPVHRRILYSMHEMGLRYNKSFTKSARVVGECFKYHPHGDSAIYDSLVRMAQDFSLRYPLVHGHGNFGCFTGNTKIKLLDGTSKSFKELCKIYKKNEIFYVYSINRKGETVIGEAKSPRLTKKKTKIIELTLDTGKKIRCTPNHKFLLKNLKYKEAKDLTPKDSLMPGYFKTSPIRGNTELDNYLMIKDNKTEEYVFVHEIADKHNLNKKVYAESDGQVRHHIDFNKFNNKPDNLKRTNWNEHTKIHNDHISILWKFKEFRKKQSEGVKSFYKNNPEFVERLRERIIKRNKYKNFIKKNTKKIKKVWKNKELRKRLSDKLKEHFNKNPEKRKIMSEFSKKLWSDTQKRKEMIEKIKAASNHKVSWKKEEYKNKVIRNRILYYINRLINNIREENINEKNYNSYRNNNCFPKFKTAIKYFKNINEMVSLAKEYNHYIINIKFLDTPEDVYDITVNKYHNFLLNCEVFVHNSVEGFSQAHMRYTEAKLSKIAEEMLLDIDKETVDFIPNFDGSLQEPIVLPAKLPNLLINGSSGIAVGMATNIPPHNLKESIDAVIAQINNPEIEIEELMQHIKGPDFPTRAYILGLNGINQAYKTGRGKITIRAKTEIKENKIIITEIPYQINKTSLIEGIANLVREKRVEGISDIRDESDRRGMSIVVITKKDSNPEIVLNQLYKHSMLQTTFGIIMLALDNNQPKVMNLKQIINCYILHRKDVVTRRTKFELKKAEARSHILEGLKTALNNIDPIIKLIKASKDPETAKKALVKNYNLTEIQSQAILDMRLQRLTSLEQDKINEEYSNLQSLIKELKDILASEKRILTIIKDELLSLKQDFEDERRTQILDIEEEIETEDLIKENDIVITSTYTGYIKQTQLEEYKQQRRGGKGIIATETKEEDVVEHLFITSNHNYLLFFTDKGRVYWLKAYRIPSGSRYSKGKAIINLLKLKEKEEKINAILPISKFNEKDYLLFVTKKGLIKKTKLTHFSKPRKTGKHAITLKDNDELVNVRITPGNLDILIGTKKGKAICFNEKDVRETGRTASGVRAIRLAKEDLVVGLEVALKTASLLTITENGYGKRTSTEEYRKIRRGGKGVRNIICSERNGNVVGIKTVKDNDEIMLISREGIIIRVPVNNISIIGRNTKGVRIMKLNDKDKVKNIARVVIK